MQIRKALLSDKPYIANLISHLRLDMPGFVWNQPEFIEKQLASEEYFVAEEGEEIAGIVSLRKRQEKMYIETLAVDPKYRRQGIGTRLVEFAKEAAKGKGLQQVCACSFFEYHIGDFYKNQGFSLVDRPGVYNGRKYYIFIAEV